MQLSNEELREIFVAPGHVTETDFERAVQVAQTNRTSVEVQLVLLGLVSDHNVGKAIADMRDLPYHDLSTAAIPDSGLEYIPEIVARSQQAIIYEESADTLRVATLHPDNFEFKKLLEKKTGKQVALSYTSYGTLMEALNVYAGNYADRIEATVAQCTGGKEEHRIVELVELVLEYGYSSKASDIHIEPLATDISVRFRIDGVLHEIVRYPKSLHDQVSFRIKILSRMRTDEQGKAQDGRFTHTFSDETFDIRVSIMPTTEGENVVLRLLSSNNRKYTLETLGFSTSDYEKVERALVQPHGLILAVGPTGSGKTTVLYSLLGRLNDHSVNIMTIEDPVEYDIEHVQQTQVNPSKELTFATGLRSIVRQDPDIIMVGEIRDEETADIAVNAAMTGHLLFSTMHTNDAATTFPRLSEMGVEAFLAASSIRLVVSLRLVRTICKHCRESHFLSKEQQELIKSRPEVERLLVEVSGRKELGKMRFYRGAGCKACNSTGFSGRRAIFEVMEVTTDIRLLITNRASSDDIHAAAVAAGMRPLLYDGIEKALNGETTLMEVITSTYA